MVRENYSREFYLQVDTHHKISHYRKMLLQNSNNINIIDINIIFYAERNDFAEIAGYRMKIILLDYQNNYDAQTD